MIEAVDTSVQLENPFPGLRSFTVDESHLFFGRDGQSDELLRKMDRSRFLAVVGVSGSGKSSLVRAGLLPSLFNGYLAIAGPEWAIADLRPGSDPFRNLATALSRTGLWNDAITADALRASSLALVGAARESAQWRKGDNLLILVDQFEELFRYQVRRDSAMADRDEKASFVKVLLEAAAHRDLPIYVVITMRSDFLGDCAQFRDLPEAINDGQYLIPRMNREDRRSAIEAPIQVAGGSITARLVHRILNDTGEDPAQLPVMQHALMRCWNYWRDRAQPDQPMDLEHYEAIGTLTRALSSHADEAYDEACRNLPGRGDEIVKRIFQRLRNQDLNGREVRRPTRFAELCAVAESSRVEMLTALECFHRDRRTFLVPAPTDSLTDDVQIDITHECLLRQWDRLVGWVAEEIESQRIYQRLADRAEEHAAPAEDDTPTIDFLSGAPLQLALDWWDRRRPSRVWAERYHPGFDGAEAFLRRSQAYRDARHRSEDEAKQREKQLQIEAARREQETRERELKKRVAYALAALALVIAVGSVFAVWWGKRQNNVSRANELAAQAKSKLVEDPVQSAQLALRGFQIHWLPEKWTTFEVQDALHQIAGTWREKLVLTGFAAPVRQVAFSPDGTLLATVDTGGALVVRDSFTGKNERQLAASGVCCVAFSLNGDLMVGGKHGLLKIERGTESARLTGSPVAALAISPDGRRVAFTVEGDEKRVRLWDGISEGALEQVMEDAIGQVDALAFSPNGQRLAGGGGGKVGGDGASGGNVTVWNVEQGVKKFDRRMTSRVRAVTFSADGNYLAATGESDARVWDTSTGRPVGMPPRLSGGNTSLAYGSRRDLALGGRDGGVVVWNAASASTISLRAHDGSVTSLSVSPDGSRLATAGDDNAVRVWDIGLTQELRTLPLEGVPATAANLIAVDSSGSRLITRWGKRDRSESSIAQDDGDFRVLDTESGEQLFARHGAGLMAVAFSKDGQSVVTAGGGFLRTWEASTGAPRQDATYPLHVGSSSLRFSVDGSELVSVLPATVTIVDVWSGKVTTSLGTGAVRPVVAALSPDKTRLAWVGADGRARVVDRASMKTTFDESAGHANQVTDVVFDPDGRLLATASSDKTAIVWDIATRTGVHQLKGHSAGLTRVAFDADGDRVATTSRDGTTQIWDVESGAQLIKLVGHAGEVSGIAFEHDHVITTGADNTVRFYTLDDAMLAAIVIDRLVRAGEQRRVDGQLRSALQAPLAVLEKNARRDEASLRVKAFADNAERLARAHDVDSATILFQKAKLLDTTVAVEPRLQAQDLSDRAQVSDMIEQGFELAQSDDPTAQKVFKAAIAKERELALQLTAGSRIVQFWKDYGERLVGSPRIPEARQAFERAEELEPNAIPSQDWNQLCLMGSLRGFASLVEDACDRVRSDPTATRRDDPNVAYQDSVAVNLVLRRHFKEAIPHFRAFVAWTEDEKKRTKRQSYIDALSENPPRNPLTPEEIRVLLRPGLWRGR